MTLIQVRVQTGIPNVKSNPYDVYCVGIWPMGDGELNKCDE